jgi:hypothetical protein
MKIDLRKPNLRELEVGTVVISTKGFEFELVLKENEKESWKDLTSGITWHDIEDKRYTHHEAVKEFEGRLPTKEEFEFAESHGFRDVLPNFLNKLFWSASVHPDNSYFAFYFNGYNGDVYNVFRDNYNVSVRCVGR